MESFPAEVATPLGFTVGVTEARWFVVVAKHPGMAGRWQAVAGAIARPSQVRRSRSDHSVLLFYQDERPGRWTCAVVKRGGDTSGFLITAYPTDAIKEGEMIWTA